MARAHSTALVFGLAIVFLRISTTSFVAPPAPDRLQRFTLSDGIASAAAAAAGLQVGFNMDALPAEARYDTTVREDMPIVPVEALIGVIAFFWIACLLAASVADKQPEWEDSSPEKEFLRKIKGSYRLLAKRNSEGVKRMAGDLRWGVGGDIARSVYNNNRADVEGKGFWQTFLPALKKEQAEEGEVTFCDAVTGKPLFIAPRGRTFAEFLEESNEKGKLIFRDAEVVTQNVRIISEGQMVSIDGTHIGSNDPDKIGNCYHISLCAVAGFPTSKDTAKVIEVPTAVGTSPEVELVPVPVEV